MINLLRNGRKTRRETRSNCAASKSDLKVWRDNNLNRQDCRNGKRYLQQAESSAIRFLIIAEALKRMAASHVHTRLPICIPMIDWRSVSLRSAHEMFYQFSHPFERGAFRFLFWWLFLHLRLRPGNVGPTCVKPFAPFSGSCLKGTTRFYPNGLRKPFSFL